MGLILSGSFIYSAQGDPPNRISYTIFEGKGIARAGQPILFKYGTFKNRHCLLEVTRKFYRVRFDEERGKYIPTGLGYQVYLEFKRGHAPISKRDKDGNLLEHNNELVLVVPPDTKPGLYRYTADLTYRCAEFGKPWAWFSSYVVDQPPAYIKVIE